MAPRPDGAARHGAGGTTGHLSVVHPPIDTSTWSVDTLDDHVAQVRGVFLETLGLEEKP